MATIRLSVFPPDVLRIFVIPERAARSAKRENPAVPLAKFVQKPSHCRWASRFRIQLWSTALLASSFVPPTASSLRSFRPQILNAFRNETMRR